MITAWRIVRSRYAETAFSGEGARLHGGRWSAPGRRVVYTASSLPLATLELLVHISSKNAVHDLSVLNCWFPEAIVEEVDRNGLPEEWNAYPPPSALQLIGNQWLASRASAVLAVPSAVVGTDLNYLLNPDHPDFASIDFGEPRPFSLDPRLLT